MLPLLFGTMAAMSLAGGFMQSQQQRAAGKLAAQQGRYQNALAKRQGEALRARGLQQAAAGQRAAIEERRQGNLLSGRARALAAASGFKMDSPSIVDHLADIDTDTDYRTSVTMAQGEQAAADSFYSAQMTEAGGSASEWAGNSEQQLAGQKANASLLQGAMQAGTYGAYAYGALPKAPAPASDSLLMNWDAGGSLFAKYGIGGPNGYA